jgi:hypothetical protein
MKARGLIRFIVLAGSVFAFHAVDVGGRRAWDCDSDMGNDFEWCNNFNVHNNEYLGGGASTEAIPEEDCEGAWVGASSWFSGPGVEPEGGLDTDQGYGDAESSSSLQAPDDSSWYGMYALVSDHWYEDVFICGSDYLEQNRTWEFEIT